MDINKDKMMLIEDENGNEVEVEILFTFESEDYKKQYVVFVDPQSTGEEAFVYAYDENGNLFEITDSKEFEMIDEVLGAYLDEEEKE